MAKRYLAIIWCFSAFCLSVQNVYATRDQRIREAEQHFLSNPKADDLCAAYLTARERSWWPLAFDDEVTLPDTLLPVKMRQGSSSQEDAPGLFSADGRFFIGIDQHAGTFLRVSTFNFSFEAIRIDDLHALSTSPHRLLATSPDGSKALLLTYDGTENGGRNATYSGNLYIVDLQTRTVLCGSNFSNIPNYANGYAITNRGDSLLMVGFQDPARRIRLLSCRDDDGRLELVRFWRAGTADVPIVQHLGHDVRYGTLEPKKRNPYTFSFRVRSGDQTLETHALSGYPGLKVSAYDFIPHNGLIFPMLRTSKVFRISTPEGRVLDFGHEFFGSKFVVRRLDSSIVVETSLDTFYVRNAVVAPSGEIVGAFVKDGKFSLKRSNFFVTSPSSVQEYNDSLSRPDFIER